MRPPATELHGAIDTYFRGELYGAGWLLALGLVSFLIVWRLWRRGPLQRGVALPLALFGLLQLAIGAGLLVRTGPQVAALHARLDSAPATLRDTELVRMERVQRQFTQLERVELGLFAAGLLLFLGARRRRPRWAGVGAGLCVSAGVFFGFDLVADWRGAVYLAALRELLPLR